MLIIANESQPTEISPEGNSAERNILFLQRISTTYSPPHIHEDNIVAF